MLVWQNTGGAVALGSVCLSGQVNSGGRKMTGVIRHITVGTLYLEGRKAATYATAAPNEAWWSGTTHTGRASTTAAYEQIPY